MPLRRADRYRRSRWKNGGGETAEIAIAPADATLDTFDWRVSMATVGSDGAFSTFTGADRTLCILDGAGISLDVDGKNHILDSASDPFAFSGDLQARATLLNGLVTDFNVMTRRGRFNHTVRRMRLRLNEALTCDASVTLLFCYNGTLDVVSDTSSERLEPLDSLVREAGDARHWQLRALVPATVYLVSIFAASPDRDHDRTAASRSPR